MNPYNSTDIKEIQVCRMFDTVAPVYDKLCHILSFNIDRYWRNRMAALVSKVNPTSVIDIATGTGDLAISMASRIKGVKITGIDISNNMLEIGRTKIRKFQLEDRVKLMQGNAESLSFDNKLFDAATIAFGIRNFQDISRSLFECHRVLKNGGFLYIMEFSTPRNRAFRFLYNTYSKFIPLIGGVVSKDRKAYKYLTGSIKEFPSKNEFMNSMLSMGFDSCKSYSLFNGIAYIYQAKKI